MELVKKTSSAVAVTGSLTTLIDWVNIESVSGFTLIVENAGGGSAKDITDVQIDTSVDGGITILTDQHAGVPAVPITDGNAPSATFTETANFIRVRAVCAESEDTTANAYLLADSSSGRIATLDDVKDRLGLSDTDHDSVINQIITGVEGVFNSHCSRKLLLNSAAVTEYYTGQGPYLQVNRYPITAITSIKIGYDYDFDSATALTLNTDYRLINGGAKGIIYRSNNIDWPDTPDCVQLIYTGGYCSAGQTAGDGEFAMPADLREAAIEQACFIFKRRDDIGLSGVGFQGGSISKFSAMNLLPMVEDILKDYRKLSL